MYYKITSCFIAFIALFNSLKGQNLPAGPRVYTDNFKTQIKEGEIIDCTKDNFGVSIKFSKQMLKYDVLSVLLYTKYKGKYDDQTMLMYKPFYPSKKEFSIKYADKDSILIYFMLENERSKDVFDAGNFATDTKDLFCPKPYYENYYFFVIKGFIKTGEHVVHDNNGTSRMEDDFDDGTELTTHSVFRVPDGNKKNTNSAVSSTTTSNESKSSEQPVDEKKDDKEGEKKDGSKLKKALLNRIPRGH